MSLNDIQPYKILTGHDEGHHQDGYKDDKEAAGLTDEEYKQRCVWRRLRQRVNLGLLSNTTQAYNRDLWSGHKGMKTTFYGLFVAVPSKSFWDNLQQDKTRPQTARVTRECLQTCQILLWPTRSLDISPIEHI
ncbi:hypothetical protein LAZ67_14002584 [Cordylochernes scorpioides]|uniref:Uncharacterized protein n=1 Tax=Cordylochernes scorpioides TaxID=51811 RepID=A0ABY6L709_9ARAC|nr:hypothetical protein LAZ67_14002584 [Cordylochernes scorpioides]